MNRVSRRRRPPGGARTSSLAALLAVAILQTACGSGNHRHFVLEEGYDGRGVERALIAPVNLVPGLPVGFIGETDAVVGAIADYLGSHGIAAAAADEAAARALWERCREETRPPDGEPDDALAAIRLVRRLRERNPFEVLVLPTLFYQEVLLRGEDVRWDGVTRRISATSSTHSRSFIRSFLQRHRAKVVTVSLHVIVFDEIGRELFHGVGGLDVAQEADLSPLARGNHWHLHQRDVLFGERPHLRQGVALAFDPYLVPEDARDPDDHSAPDPS